MNADEKIVKILEELQADVKSLHNKVDTLDQGQKTLIGKVDRLEDGQGHIHTALKIVATKQDVEVAVDSAKSELKADILMLDSKVVHIAPCGRTLGTSTYASGAGPWRG
jgi:hypothetical protein